jgi:hypothetical protein
MIAKSDDASILRGTRGSRSIEISVPGAFTAVGFSGQQKNPGASAAERGRPSLFKTIDEDRRERHDHINRSDRSTYPRRISVLTSGATPKLYLDSAELVAAATIEQNQRVETDDWGPMIQGWLDGKEPDDFHRRGTKRYQTTAAQIFTEALGGSIERMGQRDSRRITNVMSRMPGWEKRTKIRLGGIYGPARGFARKGYVQPEPIQ